MSALIAMPLQAALWGLVAGGALLVGASIGFFVRLPASVASSVMAFGIGVLISALAFDLMDEAFVRGGIWAAVSGFAIGGTLYALAGAALARGGARGRKLSGGASGATRSAAASLAIAVGSLLDGIPESGAIGISLLDGQGVALVTVLAIVVSNIPEGLSSTIGMKRAGKSAVYVFSIWITITLVCSLSAWLGYLVIGQMGPAVIGAATACAAGAIFVMLIDTMIPEAFDEIHSWSGPIAGTGFVLAFAASRLL